MGSYILNTEQQRSEMVKAIGVNSVEDLFKSIPESVKIDSLDIARGLSEFETLSKLETIAGKNTIYKTILRGAGAYDCYIPAIVKSIVSKEEFVTAYTPYQAEISQGILQSIFEFQTAICRLTGLDAANASVYDGATACAEAIACCTDKKHRKVLISEGVNPQYTETVKTYCFGSGIETVMIPLADGITDVSSVEAYADASTACVLFQNPNYFGCIENAEALSNATHCNNAKVIACVNPISLAMLKTPKEYGADLAVGEGQPLGIPLSFGGPYLGFMAADKTLIRNLPGRIVGETTDSNGDRAFVLTLQAREQHIRREKANSNICSNEALCALTASAYVAAMGAKGLRQAALSSCSKAHYFADGLKRMGFELKFGSEFFNEFVTVGGDSQAIIKALSDNGILGGLDISDNEILWCCTEKQTKAELDRALKIIEEVR